MWVIIFFSLTVLLALFISAVSYLCLCDDICSKNRDSTIINEYESEKSIVKNMNEDEIRLRNSRIYDPNYIHSNIEQSIISKNRLNTSVNTISEEERRFQVSATYHRNLKTKSPNKTPRNLDISGFSNISQSFKRSNPDFNLSRIYQN